MHPPLRFTAVSLFYDGSKGLINKDADFVFACFACFFFEGEGSVISCGKCTMSMLRCHHASGSLSTYSTLTCFIACFLQGVILLDLNVCCVSVRAGSDAGCGNPGDATGLHLTVSRSEPK